MESISFVNFVIDGKRFELPLQNIPDGSLLQTMINTSLNVNKDKDGCYILNYDKEDFIPIFKIFINSKLLYHNSKSFDYFGIDFINVLKIPFKKILYISYNI